MEPLGHLHFRGQWPMALVYTLKVAKQAGLQPQVYGWTPYSQQPELWSSPSSDGHATDNAHVGGVGLSNVLRKYLFYFILQVSYILHLVSAWPI
jgi:hypothetical protein